MDESESAYKEKIEQIWKDYDTDRNGKLDRKEAYNFLKDCMKEVSGEDPTKEEIDENFRTMDIDGSDDIDKDEALKFLKGYKIGH